MNEFTKNSHEWVAKGWGGEEIIVNKPEYCGKRMRFIKGKQCSLHYHKLKDETFYVLSGSVKMYYAEEYLWKRQEEYNNIENWEKWCHAVILSPGDSFYVPKGLLHRVVALDHSEVIEFSTESADSDSYRLLKGD